MDFGLVEIREGRTFQNCVNKIVHDVLTHSELAQGPLFIDFNLDALEFCLCVAGYFWQVEMHFDFGISQQHAQPIHFCYFTSP